MVSEKDCRRSPDIKGTPVKLKNGEEWLIQEAEMVPVFERENGQWMFRGFDVGGPYKSRFDRIRELWEVAAQNDSLPRDLLTELTTLTMELSAMALDQNYDLTAEQLGELIDPVDQAMSMAILAAVRGMELPKKDEGEAAPAESEDEKKNAKSG